MEVIKEERGASSVLVIILMLVLIILGLAIASTSISNMHLSQKKSDWLLNYYQLIGEAEKQLADINEVIIEARKNSNNDEEYKEILNEKLSQGSCRLAMPYRQEGGDCSLHFEVNEEGSQYKKRIEVSLAIPLERKAKVPYHITKYALLQEALLQEEAEEFLDPFKHMDD